MTRGFFFLQAFSTLAKFKFGVFLTSSDCLLALDFVERSGPYHSSPWRRQHCPARRQRPSASGGSSWQNCLSPAGPGDPGPGWSVCPQDISKITNLRNARVKHVKVSHVVRAPASLRPSCQPSRVADQRVSQTLTKPIPPRWLRPAGCQAEDRCCGREGRPTASGPQCQGCLIGKI